MRWSRLKLLLEGLRAPGLDLVIHCTSFRRSDAPPVGRYAVQLSGKTILEIPPNFTELMQSGEPNGDASTVTEILRWWIELPKQELLQAFHSDDRWGLVDVLRVSDKRIGKRSLEQLNRSELSAPAQLLYVKRVEQ